MSRTSRPQSDSPVSAGVQRGARLLHDPLRNKGTAFTEAERDALGLRGLLPPHVQTQEAQVERVLENLRRKESDLEKYIYLVSLQDRNETLYYRVVIDHLEEMMPLIYTPTVGQACKAFGHIFRRPRGLFVTADDRGRIDALVANWPHEDVRVVVVTDGERILGLGDLGADGMGIPIGKLALYSACAGIHPAYTLPIMLDVGTENESLHSDPLYIGLPRRRLRGEAYDEIVEELIQAVLARYPRALVQFEDFGNCNAFRLLEKYRERICTFNDDIQGTGSVALAGVYSALRITGGALTDQRFLFLGAGEAGVGIASTIVAALVDEGMTEPEARKLCRLVDSKGLVVAARDDLAEHKIPWAVDEPRCDDTVAVVESFRPTAIVGVSGVAGMFTREIVEAMARVNERPMVFALSNPTSKAECTAKQAYEWTDGRAVFASGSPFAPVDYGGRTFIPGQGNNAYIFPGVGLGVVACQVRHVTDEMFFAAAKTLAGEVSEKDLELGRIYPALSRIREVSAAIATAVAEVAYARGLADLPRPDDLGAFIREQIFEPDYPEFIETDRA